MNLNTIVNNPKKTSLIALGVVAALWLVPNMYTIVQDGTVKTSWVKYHRNPYCPVSTL